MKISGTNRASNFHEALRTGFLTKADISRLHKNRAMAWYRLAVLYGVILGVFGIIWLVSRSGWNLSSLPIAVISIVIIGWAQFSLSHGLHEAVHKNLGERQNDWLAAFLTAWPIGFTMRYREIHLNHHRHFGKGPRDPDYASYSDFPKSKLQLLVRIFINASGLPALWQFFFQGSNGEKHSIDLHHILDLTGLVAVQFCIFSAVTASIGLYAWPLFWIFPIITLGKMFSTTRLLCEHGTPNGRPVIRTIVGSQLETMTLGAFDFHYHGEHHIYPTVPFANLAELYQHHQSAIERTKGRIDSDICYESLLAGI